MLLGPHIRPVDDGCPLAARCCTPKCGERGRGMFDADAADNRVMGRCNRRRLNAESRRPQGGGGSWGGGNGRDGRRDVDDRSVSRGHGRSARACSCPCPCSYTCSCACFLRIRGRCRAGSTVSGHTVVAAASRRLGVRQPDRGFLFLADQTGTGRGAKANIAGQHREGRCGECAKQELHDGLLLLVTKGEVSSPTRESKPARRPVAYASSNASSRSSAGSSGGGVSSLPRNNICSAGVTTSRTIGPISMPPTTTVARGRCT